MSKILTPEEWREKHWDKSVWCYDDPMMKAYAKYYTQALIESMTIKDIAIGLEEMAAPRIKTFREHLNNVDLDLKKKLTGNLLMGRVEQSVLLYMDTVSNKWISVEDDLPKQHDIFVLGFTSEKWIEKVYFSGVNFYPSQDRAGEVTHWQPLPEPPNTSQIK